MFQLIGSRGCGKSSYCYQQARESNAYVIVDTCVNRKTYLHTKYGIPEDHILTVSELLSGCRVPPNSSYIIDELDDVLNSLIGGKLLGYTKTEEQYE